MWAKVSLSLQQSLYITASTSTDHPALDVAGSMQTADVAATLEPRFMYRGRAESAGAIRDAQVGEGNAPCLREDTLIYMIRPLHLEQK